MNSAQWEILRPLADESVMELVRKRLLQGFKFFDDNRLIGADREKAKLALLIVRIANPSEVFTKNELDLMNCPARQPRQPKVKAFKGMPRAKKGI